MIFLIVTPMICVLLWIIYKLIKDAQLEHAAQILSFHPSLSLTERKEAITEFITTLSRYTRIYDCCLIVNGDQIQYIHGCHDHYLSEADELIIQYSHPKKKNDPTPSPTDQDHGSKDRHTAVSKQDHVQPHTFR
jgi:hypothetical protein